MRLDTLLRRNTAVLISKTLDIILDQNSHSSEEVFQTNIKLMMSDFKMVPITEKRKYIIEDRVN